MARYAAYIRKSREDAEAEQYGEGETLARHKQRLQALADRNGHVLLEIYQEIVSGETISARPQMQRLLADVSAGKWDGVYVTEIERLARGDSMDQGLVAHAFRETNTLIITPVKTYNPSDPSDETFFEFSLFMSRQEFKTINRRLRAGIHQSVSEGKFVGGRGAYGYRKVKLPHTKGYSLDIYEPEAQVVRQIYDWYLNGMDGAPAGLQRIASRLTDIHAPLGENAVSWRPCRVHRILTCVTYIGLIEHGRQKTVKEVTSTGITKKRVLNPTGDRYQGLHQPIIDRATFDAVQAKLHDHGRHIPVRKGAAVQNMLMGLVICSECGHVMGSVPACGRQGAILKCLTHGCPTVQTYRDPVEQAILDVLRSWLEDPGSASLPPDVDNSEAELLAQSVLTIQQDLDKARRQVARLQDLVEQEVYTIQQYNERYALLRDRIATLEADLKTAQDRQSALPVYYTPAELRPAIIHLFEHYDSSTPLQRNELLRTCLSKVIYTKSVRGCGRANNQFVPSDQFVLDIYPKFR